MPLIQWNQSLSVGVIEFDSQHQVLIKLINDLNEAMLHGHGKNMVGPVVAELKKYTVSHFSYEEKILDHVGYPDLETQKKEHKRFVADIAKFESEFATGAVGLSVHVMNFLSDWLKQHILGEDSKYTKFCNDKGVQ
jgi:hemerythrin